MHQGKEQDYLRLNINMSSGETKNNNLNGIGIINRFKLFYSTGYPIYLRLYPV